MVDPLDGTKEFINKTGEFTVNIAYIQNNSPTHGVVYAPAVKRLFATDQNKKSYEILRQKDTLNYNSLAYNLNGLKEIPKPPELVNLNIAAIEAIRIIGKSLI